MAEMKVAAGSKLGASGIYKITNLINGKVYIGRATEFYKRWSKHRNDLKRGTHASPHLQNSYNKYGADTFEFSILLYCSVENLDLFEQRAIGTLQSFNNSYGYNNTKGGMGPKGRVCSAETRAKMSKAHMGNKYASYPHTEEHKKKVSEKLKGRVSPLRGRVGNRKGAKHSEESRKKMSIAHKGVHLSPEHIRGMRQAWILRKAA